MPTFKSPVARFLPLAALLVLAASSCSSGPSVGGDASLPANGLSPVGTIVAGTVTSPILNEELQDLTVAVGTIVTWVNEDPIAHTATSGKPTGTTRIWDSNTIMFGGSFSRELPESGVFPYYCVFHHGMRATITVVGA
ncbi:MAG: hypothetical protein O3B84_06150 [Chloroflexi bacterium]|nr:hypothetical protein [Chloroflexota bacterium]